MATEAGIAEVLLPTKGEAEVACLTTAQLEQTVIETLAVELKKCGDSQLNECRGTEDNQVDTTNNVVMSKNSGALEDASFLASLSVPAVSKEEASGPVDCQVRQLTPLETVIPEDSKHFEKAQQDGVLDEVDQNGKSHDVLNTDSSEVAKSGEPNSEVEVEKNEINVGRNVEVVLDQKEIVDEGSVSIAEETKDSLKDEKLGKTENSHAESSAKEIMGVDEGTLDRKIEAIADPPEVTVDKDDQPVKETSFSDEISLSKEYTEVRSSEDVKEDKCVNAVADEMASESETDKEKDQNIILSQESQTNEIIDSKKDEPESITVTEEVKETDSAFEEKEEVPTQTEENSDLLKIYPEVGPNYVARESPIETTEKTQIIEETTQVKGKESEQSNNDANETQVTGSSIVPPEDIINVKAIQAEQTDLVSTVSDDKPAVFKEELQQSVKSEEARPVDSELVTSIKESIKEKEKEEEIIYSPPAKGDEVCSEEIVKTESAEVELPENDLGDLPAVRLLVKQAEVANGKKIEILKVESHEDEAKKQEGHEDKEVLTEVVGVNESETKKETESTAQESVQKKDEEKSLNPIEASIEETKVVFSEEDVLKSRDEDDAHAHEITQGNVDTEHIVERDFTLPIPESAQEEPEKDSQNNEKEAEKSNEEDSLGEVIKEADVKGLSPQTSQEIAVETSTDHTYEAETSKEEVIKELESSEEHEIIPRITTKDVEMISDASPVKQENDEKIDEESHGQSTSADFDNEQSIGEVTVSTREFIPVDTNENSQDSIKDEEKLNEVSTADIKEESSKNYLPPEITQEDVNEKPEDHENEAESCNVKAIDERETAGHNDTIPSEIDKDVESSLWALSEGKHQDSTEVPVEETKAEIFKDEALKSEGEVDNNEQAIKVDCEKEEAIEDVKLYPADTTQEVASNNTQDKARDDERAHEESSAEIAAEESASQFSSENTQKCTVKAQEEERAHDNSSAEITEEESVNQSSSENTREDTIKARDEERTHEESLAEITEEESASQFSSKNTQEDNIKTGKSSDKVPELEVVDEDTSIPCQTNKDDAISVHTLLVKQEEGQHEEVQYVEPIKDSVEEIKIEVPKEVILNQRNEDENHGQSQEEVFDGEQIVEEATLKSPEFQETKKCPLDDMEEKEIKEEIKTEIINEEATETSKDQETEADTCKEEVAQVFETPRPIDSSTREMNIEAECSVDAQEAVKPEDQIEDLIEKTAEDTSTVKKLKEVDGSSDEFTEKGVEVASKTEENQQAVHEHKEEKVEELHEVTTEENKTESSENATCEEVEGNILNLKGTSDTEKAESVDHSADDLKEINEVETSGASESTQCKNTEDALEKLVVSPSGEQEDEKENKGQDLIGASEVENKDEATTMVKDDVKTTLTDKDIELSYKGEEFSQQTTKEAESQENISTSVLLTSEASETEPPSDNATPSSVEVEGSVKNLEDTLECEKKQKTTEITENASYPEDAVQEAKTAGADESILFVTNKDVQSSVDPPSEKRDEDQYIHPTKTLIDEKKAEDEHDHKDEAIENVIDVEAKGKEDEKDTQDDEPAEKLEQLPNMIPEETETEVKVTTENLEEILETEKKEEKEHELDKSNVSENEVVQELETAEADESTLYETNKDVKSSAGPSLEKNEEGQVIEPAEVIEEKKVKGTYTTEEEQDNQDEVTERTIGIAQEETPGVKHEDFVQVTLGETETEIPSENAGTSTYEDVEETAENPSAKQEESQCLEPAEVLTEEKKVEDTLLTEVVNDDQDNKVETTEKGIDITKEGDIDKIQTTQKDEPEMKLEDLNQVTVEETEIEPVSENAAASTHEEVEVAIEKLDIPSEKQAESQSLEPAEVLTEKKVEDTLTTELVKGDHNKKVEAAERTIDVAKRDQDEKDVTQKDESGEKVEDLVQEKPEEKTPAGEYSGASENIEETSETAKRENSDTNDSEKEVAQETAIVNEGIQYDSNKEFESYGDPSSEKKEEDLSLEPTEVLEKKNEDTLHVEVVKEDSDNNLEATKQTSDLDTKDEDVKPFTEKDKPEEKLENPIKVTPEDSETESTSENANLTDEILEAVSKGEHTNSVDNAIDLENEATETTSGGQVMIEQLSRELNFAEESKFTDTQTTEDTEAAQVITEPHSLIQDENVEESSKELEKQEEGTQPKDIEHSEVKDLVEKANPESLEVKEKQTEDEHSTETMGSPEKEEVAREETQEKETSLTEEKSDYIVAGEERGLATDDDVLAQSRTVRTVLSADLSGEISLKEAEPDSEKQLENSDIAPEGKSEESNVGDVRVQSVSADISGEETSLKEIETFVQEQTETGLKETKQDDEEKTTCFEVVNEVKEIPSISAETASEETSLAVTEQESKQQVRSYDIASEDKSVSSSVDVREQSDSLSSEVVSEDKPDDEEQIKSLNIDSQPDPVPTGTLSEDVRLQEPEQDSEEQIRSYDAASEEKVLASSLAVDVASKSISTTTPSEETSLKEAEFVNEEEINNNDLPREEKDLASEVRSDSKPCVAKQDNDQTMSSDVAPEEKSLPSSADTDVQSATLSSEVVSEEKRLEEDEPTYNEQIKSLDIGSQSDAVPTGTLSEDTTLKKPEPDSEEQVKSYEITSEEKSTAINLDVATPSDSILTTIPNEETNLKEVELFNEDKIISNDTPPEDKGLDSEVKFDFVATKETCEPEAKQDDDQAKTSGVAPGEKSRPSSVETDVQYESISTGPVSEGTSVGEAKQDHEEQVESRAIDPEDALSVQDRDIGIQEVVVSNEIQKETSKLEENEEKKELEAADEYEEKTRQETESESPIATPDNEQCKSVVERPLYVSSEEDLLDHSSGPSTEHEPQKTEANDKSDETTAVDDSQCVDKKTPATESTKEEVLLELEEETREVNEQPEIIPTDAIPNKVHESVQEDVESATIEQDLGRESPTSEFPLMSTEREDIFEEKNSSQILAEVEETNSNGQPSDSPVEAYATEKSEEPVPTVAVLEKENVNVDEGSKFVGASSSTPEEENILEEFVRNVENKCDENETPSVGGEKALTNFEEAHLIEEPEKPVDKHESIVVQERSFDLVSEQPAEQKETEIENILPEKCSIQEVEDVKPVSDTEVIYAPSTIPVVELQETVEIKEAAKESSQEVPNDEISIDQLQVPSSMLLPEKQDHETTTSETKEEIDEEGGYQDKENRDPELHEAAEEKQGSYGAEEEPSAAHETVLESSYESPQVVSKDEVVIDRDLPAGISTELIQVTSSTLVPEESEPKIAMELNQKAEEVTTKEIEILDDKKIVDSLATELAEETKAKEDLEEDITKAPADTIDVVAEVENIEKLDLPSLPEEHDVGINTTIKEVVEDKKTEEAITGDEAKDYSETTTLDEACFQKEETKEVNASVEDRVEVKDAVTAVSDSDSQIAQVATKEEAIIRDIFTEKLSDVQIEQDDGNKSPAEEKEKLEEVEILSHEKKETSSEAKSDEAGLTKKEPEIKESASTFEVLNEDIADDVSEASKALSKETPETVVFSREATNLQSVITDDDNIISKDVATMAKMVEDNNKAKISNKGVCLEKDEPKKPELSEPRVYAGDVVHEGLKEVTEVEARDNEEDTRKAYSPAEKEKAVETIEERDFEDKVESPEPITSIEDVEIIEDHLKIATTDLKTQGSQFEKKTEAEVLEKEVCKDEVSTEVRQEKGRPNVEEVHAIRREINQPEEIPKTSGVEKSPSEAKPQVTTRDIETPTELAKSTGEILQRDLTDKEQKEEKISKPELISLSDLMESPKEETDQKSDHSTEGTAEPKKDKEAENEKTKTEKEKDHDDEEEEEEEHEDSEHPDAPILVQSSEDNNAKTPRKKSHGLFSGVGSKVKHSITKVKKAITGKSPNTKTQPSSS